LKYWDESGNAVYQRTYHGPDFYLSKNSRNNWKVSVFTRLWEYKYKGLKYWQH
jgi:hypothetical protein